MSSITVAQFAIELKMPSNTLLEQLREAGVNLTSVDASVTEGDKAKLLESLRRSHGATEGTKITLTRRKTSEIRQADGAGRSRTIQVEVRKKRTFVKRDATETGEVPAVEDAETQALTQDPTSGVEQTTPSAVATPTDTLAAPPSTDAQASAAQPTEAQAPAVQATEAQATEAQATEAQATEALAPVAQATEAPAADTQTPREASS